MCKNVYSDILPRFGVTSCLRKYATSCFLACDILPHSGALPQEKSAFGYFTKPPIIEMFPTLQLDHLFAHVPLQNPQKLVSFVH